MHLGAVLNGMGSFWALIYLKNEERLVWDSGRDETCGQTDFWENIVFADALNSEPRLSFGKDDSFEWFLRHTGGSIDTNNQNAAVGVRERRQYLRQLPLHIVVKCGFVFNSRVLVEPFAEFLYIFEPEIRNWFREEHGSDTELSAKSISRRTSPPFDARNLRSIALGGFANVNLARDSDQSW